MTNGLLARRIIRQILLWVMLPAVPALGQASFSGIGFAKGFGSSSAWGVDHAGDIVVGQSGGSMRWEEGVAERIGTGLAVGVSGDGSVVVGFYGVSPTREEAFRWQDGTVIGLGFLPDYDSSLAWDVSADGSVVVGWGREGVSTRPFRWEDGTMEALSSSGNAYGVSANGRIIVGRRNGPDSTEAVRWVDGVAEVLPPPNFQPRDVSDDGSVIVGNSGARSYIWREGQGTTEIPQISPGAHTQAHAVSGDGQVVAGVTLAGGAFIWTEATGTLLLKQVLEELYGLDLMGWDLAIVWYHGINNDGTVIVGEGTNPEGDHEGWRAVLPPWPVAGAPEVPEAGEPEMSVYPNPVRGRATVRLIVPAASHARVEVVDVLGRVVAVLREGLLAAGAHALTFSAENLPAGVYVVRAELASGPAVSQTITILR